MNRAATDWIGTAEHWEESFVVMHRGTLSPGGTVWEGQAAEVAQERTFADLRRVRGFADRLQEAAAVAGRGADQTDYLKSKAIEGGW